MVGAFDPDLEIYVWKIKYVSYDGPHNLENDVCVIAQTPIQAIRMLSEDLDQTYPEGPSIDVLEIVRIGGVFHPFGIGQPISELLKHRALKLDDGVA